MGQLKSNQVWVKELIARKTESEKQESRALAIEAAGNHRQDPTRQILQDLQQQGYEVVTWDSRNSAHPPCNALENQQWTIEAFLTGLVHDAPMFERSHPGDKNCKVIISGPDLQTLILDSFGNITEA
jgi:hypothetical protein